MKLSLKILKAINRGLNEALSDLIDDKDDSLYTSRSHNISLYANQYKKDLIWIQDNFIDLDLPSGTLWCKLNLGATNEDTPESWYGDYYMWGSTKPNTNDKYCWENVPFNNGSSVYNGEYFVKNKNKFISKEGDLLPEHDAAYQENHLMHIPTKELIEELSELPNKWVINYNGIYDLNGRVFTGKNGNELFIPAAGFRDGGCRRNSGDVCRYQSSSIDLSDNDYSHELYLHSGNTYFTSGLRYVGYSIRPVCDKKDLVN